MKNEEFMIHAEILKEYDLQNKAYNWWRSLNESIGDDCRVALAKKHGYVSWMMKIENIIDVYNKEHNDIEGRGE